MRAARSASQRGAALITVLMIVAAMSVVAVGLTQTVTAATQRARALDGQAQLRLYAAAAEEVAEIQVARILSSIEGRLIAGLPGLNEAQTIPVDGGLLRVRVSDVTNCFDVNQLVVGGDRGDRVKVPKAVDHYLDILAAAGFDQADAAGLAASLVDWMDSDSLPEIGGGEDGYYAGETPSYRTSGRPLANLSELRAIRNYDRDILQTLQPLICARPVRPDSGLAVLNLNTLTEAQAGLLSLTFSGALDVRDARRLIADRPIVGWPDVDAFLADPVIAGIAPALRKVDRLGTVSTHMEVYAEVAYRQQTMSMIFLFEARPGQLVRTLRRERVG